MRTAKIPKRIINNLHFLKKLISNRNSRKNCCNLLSKATAEQLFCLVEIAFNILANNRLPLSIKQYKFQRAIEQLSKSQSPNSAKGILLPPQKGSGPVLASVLASIVVPLIVEYISSKFH